MHIVLPLIPDRLVVVVFVNTRYNHLEGRVSVNE